MEPDPTVGVFNSNVRDDRKTYKRDIEHKNQMDGEAITATVVEITEMTSTTTSAPAGESTIRATTENPEMQTTTVATTAATTTATSIPITIRPTSTTTLPPTTEVSTAENSELQPISSAYYGGAPNVYANLVYFTTSEPVQNLESPTENPHTASDRSDFSKFRPSIRYDYQNYRYDTDNHFLPIVGAEHFF